MLDLVTILLTLALLPFFSTMFYLHIQRARKATAIHGYRNGYHANSVQRGVFVVVDQNNQINKNRGGN